MRKQININKSKNKNGMEQLIKKEEAERIIAKQAPIRSMRQNSP
jgi:hypothetical protein